MRGRLAIGLLLAAVLLTGGIAQGERVQIGKVIVGFDGGFSPRSLPRHEPVPITVNFAGSIGTTDGSHPPALRRLQIEVNRHGRLTTRGLPRCSAPLLQSTDSDVALARCRPALVGRGRFAADLEFDQEGLPAKGRVLIFNARHRGEPALLFHVFGTVPVRATLVLPMTIVRREKGQFGTVLSAVIPRLAGGLGSITHLSMRIGRTYSFRGERLSFISGSCATLAGFQSAIFPLARGNFSFSDGSQLEITLNRRCRVR
jgi:hypothetical protein